jgi:hypothetical protein
MGTSLVPLLVSTYYFSLPRVLLSLFPVVLLIASFTRDRDLAHNIVLAIFVPVATLGVVTFTRFLWFF